LHPDVFISIHCNQAARNAAQGIEGILAATKCYHEFWTTVQIRKIVGSKSFLNSIMLWGLRIRGMKYANFQVLPRKPNTSGPGVFVGIWGFCPNWEEAENSQKVSHNSLYIGYDPSIIKGRG